MKWTVKLVAETAPGSVTEHDLLTLERPNQLTLARLGLSVEETKQLLAALQNQLMPAQIERHGQSCVTCIVRRATPADLPRMGRLGALLVETHHAFDARRFLAASNRTPADYASFLGTHLNNPHVCIFVAEDNGAVVGYAFTALEGCDYMLLRGPAGVVHDLIVDPDYRGRGVGRLLLEATLAHLKSCGVPRAVLSTAEGNEAAQRLFASMGFRRTMIEMTRELDDPAR